MRPRDLRGPGGQAGRAIDTRVGPASHARVGHASDTPDNEPQRLACSPGCGGPGIPLQRYWPRGRFSPVVALGARCVNISITRGILPGRGVVLSLDRRLDHAHGAHPGLPYANSCSIASLFYRIRVRSNGDTVVFYRAGTTF